MARFKKISDPPGWSDLKKKFRPVPGSGVCGLLHKNPIRVIRTCPGPDQQAKKYG
jgi:hypothetical protein